MMMLEDVLEDDIVYVWISFENFNYLIGIHDPRSNKTLPRGVISHWFQIDLAKLA